MAIIMQSVVGCPEYPVIYYNLLLRENDGSDVLMGPSTEHSFTLNSTHIRENSHYNYVIEAVNTVGIKSQSEERDFCE